GDRERAAGLSAWTASAPPVRARSRPRTRRGRPVTPAADRERATAHAPGPGVAAQGADARVHATGVAGDKPGRHGNVAAWRLDPRQARDRCSVVSRNGDETRARAIVLVPGKVSRC